MSAPIRVTLLAALNANALPWSHGSARNKASTHTLLWMYSRGRGRGTGRDITIDPHGATAWLLAHGHTGRAKNMAALVAAVADAAAKAEAEEHDATKKHNYE